MVKSDSFCADCMEEMKRYPDKFFDLAVVDPPYGVGGKAFREKSASEAGLTDIGGNQQNRRDVGGEIQKKS